ncbi:MAG: 3'-5' exonuclease domain-containing protein 2 [Dysgonamonadaceae bacterium]|jgi:ribonuclease D|nr:3'-5' exonuclease domain-containing protein 2 [Dysgonamonadaceae bacterium]
MGKSITKEELSKYPKEEFSGDIFLVDSLRSSKMAYEVLSREKMLGFDTESRPSFHKGSVNNVALIQISTENLCCLFRLNKTGYLPHLIDILTNPNILKIGLSLRDDFRNMNKTLKFEPQGFIDLQNIVAGYGIDELSLQKIYALLFHKKISKNQRLTNWEAQYLTEQQMSYAALDAWACLKIYRHLCRLKNESV